MSLDLEPRDGDFVRYIELCLARQSLVKSPGAAPARTDESSASYLAGRQATPVSRAPDAAAASGTGANGSGAVSHETFLSTNGVFFFLLVLIVGALFLGRVMIPVFAVILAIWLGARNKARSRAARGQQ